MRDFDNLISNRFLIERGDRRDIGKKIFFKKEESREKGERRF